MPPNGALSLSFMNLQRWVSALSIGTGQAKSVRKIWITAFWDLGSADRHAIPLLYRDAVTRELLPVFFGVRTNKIG